MMSDKNTIIEKDGNTYKIDWQNCEDSGYITKSGFEGGYFFELPPQKPISKQEMISCFESLDADIEDRPDWDKEEAEEVLEEVLQMKIGKTDKVCDIITDYNILASLCAKDAYLQLVMSSGEVSLWKSEAESKNDSGANALKKWNLSEREISMLMDAAPEIIDVY